MLYQYYGSQNDDEDEIESTISEDSYARIFEESESMSTATEGNAQLPTESGHPEKRRRVEKPYSLRTFCPVRWYSAWTVMCRFYELFEAITRLRIECYVDEKLKKNGGTLLCASLEGIRKEDVFKIISFLKPIVDGIDFFQRTMAHHIDVSHILNNLLLFYQQHTQSCDGNDDSQVIVAITTERFYDLFSSRLEMFGSETSNLRLLFTDEKARELEGHLTLDDEAVQAFGMLLLPELKSFFRQNHYQNWNRLANLAYSQALRFLVDYEAREGLTLDEYFRFTSSLYPELTIVYKQEYCSPASTASVERSFSVQGCYMQPRRSSMKGSTIRDLMMIRMNIALGERSGWANGLLDYIKTKTLIEVDH